MLCCRGIPELVNSKVPATWEAAPVQDHPQAMLVLVFLTCYFIRSEDRTAGSRVVSSSSVGFFLHEWAYVPGAPPRLQRTTLRQLSAYKSEVLLCDSQKKRPRQCLKWLSGMAPASAPGEHTLLQRIWKGPEHPAKWFSKSQLQVVCFYLLLLSTICATKKRLNSPVEITVTHGGFEPLRIWLTLNILSQGRL